MTLELSLYNAVTARIMLCLVLSLSLAACAIRGNNWQSKSQSNAVSVQVREYGDTKLPEFMAEVEIDASLQQVMMVLTDFSAYPEWVYQCESLAIIDALSYTEAYIYQVNALPFIKDRDIIMHGEVIANDSSDEVRIELRSSPDYCQDKSSSLCVKAQAAPHIRVRDAQGTMLVQKLGPNITQVSWRQFVDPGGQVPKWLTRLMIKQVPIQSLQQLKTLVEARHAQSSEL